MKITFVIGTRPELIKLAPVILEFQKSNFEIDILSSAQHKELLSPYWDTFGVKPNFELDLMLPGQSLTSLTSRALLGFQNYFDTVKVMPDFVMAQGDTTTVMATSLVCFYQNIKFLHLEAGLRSFDLFNPFPEELNRKVASSIAFHHFCPTEISMNNLLKEGISKRSISLVGNTVVDSLNYFKNLPSFLENKWINKELNLIDSFNKVVLVTCHRRENHGENLEQIIEAINDLSNENKDILFIWPIHPNPNVTDIVNQKISKNINVLLVKPLEYLDLIKVLSKSMCAISDSGGIQEEAPSFRVPVIILRKVTERPEGISKGLAFLVGANKNNIINKFEELKLIQPRFTNNPYGDGNSSKKIMKEIESWFK